MSYIRKQNFVLFVYWSVHNAPAITPRNRNEVMPSNDCIELCCGVQPEHLVCPDRVIKVYHPQQPLSTAHYEPKQYPSVLLRAGGRGGVLPPQECLTSAQWRSAPDRRASARLPGGVRGGSVWSGVRQRHMWEAGTHTPTSVTYHKGFWLWNIFLGPAIYTYTRLLHEMQCVDNIYILNIYFLLQIYSDLHKILHKYCSILL